MSIIDAISDALTRSPQGETDGSDAGADAEADAGVDHGADADPAGSYWCDDCTVRVLDIEVDAEGLARDPEGVPLCPDCDEPMRFERTGGPGCAC